MENDTYATYKEAQRELSRLGFVAVIWTSLGELHVKVERNGVSYHHLIRCGTDYSRWGITTRQHTPAVLPDMKAYVATLIRRNTVPHTSQ